MGGREIEPDGGAADEAEALLSSEHGIDVAIEVLRRALQRGLIEHVARITDRLLEAPAPSQSPCCGAQSAVSSPAAEGAGVGSAETGLDGATRTAQRIALGGDEAMVLDLVLELVMWQLDGAALARCAGVCRSLSLVARDGHRWRALVWVFGSGV